jgi:hypothetical protein
VSKALKKGLKLVVCLNKVVATQTERKHGVLGEAPRSAACKRALSYSA